MSDQDQQMESNDAVDVMTGASTQVSGNEDELMAPFLPRDDEADNTIVTDDNTEEETEQVESSGEQGESEPDETKTDESAADKDDASEGDVIPEDLVNAAKALGYDDEDIEALGTKALQKHIEFFAKAAYEATSAQATERQQNQADLETSIANDAEGKAALELLREQNPEVLKAVEAIVAPIIGQMSALQQSMGQRQQDEWLNRFDSWVGSLPKEAQEILGTETFDHIDQKGEHFAARVKVAEAYKALRQNPTFSKMGETELFNMSLRTVHGDRINQLADSAKSAVLRDKSRARANRVVMQPSGASGNNQAARELAPSRSQRQIALEEEARDFGFLPTEYERDAVG